MIFDELKQSIEQLARIHKEKVAICIQTEEGTISINADMKMRSASIIKVPLALACLYQAEQKKLVLNQPIQVENKVAGSGVLNYLSGNPSLTLINYIELAMIVSDNTASNILIDAAGIEQINLFMDSIGMKNTVLKRYFMDFEALKDGLENKTTAQDMMTCLTILTEENSWLSAQSRHQLQQILSHQQFQHKLARYASTAGADIFIAHKTGELDGIEHDIGVMQKEEVQVKVVVLTTGWEHATEAQRFIGEVGKEVMKYMQK